VTSPSASSPASRPPRRVRPAEGGREGGPGGERGRGGARGRAVTDAGTPGGGLARTRRPPRAAAGQPEANAGSARPTNASEG
jgi:hypothetical protein